APPRGPAMVAEALGPGHHLHGRDELRYHGGRALLGGHHLRSRFRHRRISGSAALAVAPRRIAPQTGNMVDAVIKLGGDVLAAPALDSAAAEIAHARAAGRRLVVVHGGGPQTTELSRRLGIEPQLVGGRLVTDAAALDVVKMVVAGRLNVDLVGALRGAGVPAVGLSGSSGVVRAHRRPPRAVSGSDGALVDFGFVGD